MGTYHCSTIACGENKTIFPTYRTNFASICGYFFSLLLLLPFVRTVCNCSCFRLFISLNPNGGGSITRSRYILFTQHLWPSIMSGHSRCMLFAAHSCVCIVADCVSCGYCSRYDRCTPFRPISFDYGCLCLSLSASFALIFLRNHCSRSAAVVAMKNGLGPSN